MVNRASLVSSSRPWCWQVEGGSGADCTDIMGLFDQYLGRHISDTVGDLLGEDAGSIIGVVQNTLGGSPEELVALVGGQTEEDQQAAVPAETATGLGGEADTPP